MESQTTVLTDINNNSSEVIFVCQQEKIRVIFILIIDT